MNLKSTRIALLALLISIGSVSAQEGGAQDTLGRTVENILNTLEVKNRLKISGYIQTQFQITDSAGSRGFAGGDFAQGVDKRFQVRRGRVKFVYDAAANSKGISTSQYVLQFDVTQNGLTIKDAYVKITDPWSGWFSMTAGMQNRPFGFEIQYSSSQRESPERGRLSQIIFPNERDLGAMLSIQGPKSSQWNWLKIDAGLFNGTGAPGVGANTSDFDKYKDFIGRISASRTSKSEKIKWGLGASYYDGGFRQDVSDRYAMATGTGAPGFSIDQPRTAINSSINNRKRVKRNDIGFDGQVNIDWFAGLTGLRAEYVFGEQPAVSGSSTSPSSAPTQSSVINTTVVTGFDSLGNPLTTNISSSTTSASDIYVRKFNGAYFYFLQNIGSSPFQAIVKYDFYDPNIDVEGDEIGKAPGSGMKTTNATDIKYSTVGLGLLYRWDANFRITAYYDMVKNETSSNLSGYTNDIKDNVFTLRVQAKF